MTQADPGQVSAVVCTRNSATSIEACLRSLRDSGVGQIIVVDASSRDGTREIAAALADEVMTDAGKGLGAARNLGIGATNGRFVLNCGADNVFPPGALHAMLEAKQTGGFDGVSAMTDVVGRSYLAWAMRRYRWARYTPGERDVIGTPTLFDGASLREHPFDNAARYSDDSELCERWHRLLNARFAIADVRVEEHGQTDAPSLITRYLTYGVSDSEIYTRHRADWPAWRRMKSAIHPWRVEVVQPFRATPFPVNVAITPFLVAIALVRYCGWARAAKRVRAR